MKFRWLKDYQELEEHLLYLRWNLNKSKLELHRWVYGDLSGVRLERNSRSSSLEENIQKIEEEIERLEMQKSEMIFLVETFKGMDNDIIRMKYIEDMCLEDIAEEIGYSISHVRKRYTEIRKTLNFIDDYDCRRSERNAMQGELDYFAEERAQTSLF